MNNWALKYSDRRLLLNAAGGVWLFDTRETARWMAATLRQMGKTEIPVPVKVNVEVVP